MPNIQKPILGIHSAKTVKGTVSPITQMQSTTPKQRHCPKALYLNPNSNRQRQNVSGGAQLQSKRGPECWVGSCIPQDSPGHQKCPLQEPSTLCLPHHPAVFHSKSTNCVFILLPISKGIQWLIYKVL